MTTIAYINLIIGYGLCVHAQHSRGLDSHVFDADSPFQQVLQERLARPSIRRCIATSVAGLVVEVGQRPIGTKKY